MPKAYKPTPAMWDVFFAFRQGRSSIFSTTERSEARWLYHQLYSSGEPVELRIEGEFWTVIKV